MGVGEECTRSAPWGEAPLQSSELPALLSTCWLLKVAGNLQIWHSLRRVVRRRERGGRSQDMEGGSQRGTRERPGGPERKGVQTEGEGEIEY